MPVFFPGAIHRDFLYLPAISQDTSQQPEHPTELRELHIYQKRQGNTGELAFLLVIGDSWF
jgi:hypothetical protein